MPHKSYTPEAEVNGRVVITFTNALPMYSDIMTTILKKHGLSDIKTDCWYNMQSWLDALKEVGDSYGPFTIMTIGKALPDSLPPEPETNFRSIFNGMNPNYQASHRNGEIGFIDLIEYDEMEKKAKIRVLNPYPPEFAEGIIKGFLRKYKSERSGTVPHVKIEVNPENPDDRIYVTSW